MAPGGDRAATARLLGRDHREAVFDERRPAEHRPARAELVDWLTDEAWASADSNVEALTRKQFGCISDVRMAGPFGRRAASDTIRHYPAEKPVDTGLVLAEPG